MNNEVFDATFKNVFEKIRIIAGIIDKQNEKIDNLEKKSTYIRT